MVQWTQTHGSPFDFHYRANCNDDEKVHHCPQYDTHTANEPASQPASQPASLPGCAVCIQLRSEKLIRYSHIQEVLKDGSALLQIFFDVLLHIQFMNIVIEKLNWVKRLVFSQLKTTYITSD